MKLKLLRIFRTNFCRSKRHSFIAFSANLKGLAAKFFVSYPPAATDSKLSFCSLELALSNLEFVIIIARFLQSLNIIIQKDLSFTYNFRVGEGSQAMERNTIKDNSCLHRYIGD